MRRIVYHKGQQVGTKGITFVEDVAPKIEKSGRKRRRAVFLCLCGKEYTTTVHDVVIDKSSSCGCAKGNSMIEYNYGDMINNVMFIRSLGTKTKIKAQYAVFECPRCGSHWEASIANVKTGNVKSCCNNAGCWNRSKWISTYKISYLYKILLYNDEEAFIKIGITSHRNLNKRLRSFPYQYKVLKTIKGEAGFIFDLENRILRMFK